MDGTIHLIRIINKEDKNYILCQSEEGYWLLVLFQILAT